MAPDVKVLLETTADQISPWEKGESKLSRPGKAPNAINK
jgi:hypothetical protein